MLVKVLKKIAVLLIVANVVHVLEVDDIEDDVRSFIENDLSKERGVNYLYDNITVYFHFQNFVKSMQKLEFSLFFN